MESIIMTDMNIDRLISNDRHGVYRKSSGDLVWLPLKRHQDWLRKGMTFVCEAERVDEEKVRQLAGEAEDERRKKAEALIEKYGEGIASEFPEYFVGFNVKKRKKISEHE
jgi:hypothetical protein